MPLFTEGYRKEILDSVVESLKNDPRIMGVFLYGSAVTGFKDRLSDIDLTVVISDKSDIETIYNDWQSNNKNLLSIIHQCVEKHSQNKRVYMLWLEGFLKLDMILLNQSFLSDRYPKWKVIFDRVDKIENILQQNWLNLQSPDLKEFYFFRLDRIWFFITNVIINLQRNNPWRALLFIDAIRFRTLELASLRLGPGQDFKRFVDINHLPKDFLEKLRKALVDDPSPLKIKKALKSAVDCFFDEAQRIDKILNINASSNLRLKMKEYISLTEFED